MNLFTCGYYPGTFSLFRVTDGIWRRIQGIYQFLIFSALLLSSECIAMAYISCTIQQLPWDMTLAVIPFLAAFSIYNLNRKTDEDEDAVNFQTRFAFTKRYEAYLYNGSLLALALALVLAALSGIPSLLATGAPFILGTLYSFRLLPAWSGYRRLKEIPAVKNIVVGLAWGIFLSFLPVFFWHKEPGPATLVTFLLFFMWGFMASLIPDIRDRDGDAAASITTIPVIFGKMQTQRILTGALLLIGIPLAVYSLFVLPPFATLIVVAANFYSHGCTALADRDEIIHVVADCISDGQYIFFAVTVFFIVALHPWY